MPRKSVALLVLLFLASACAPAASAPTPAPLSLTATEPPTEVIKRPAPPILGQFDPASVQNIKLEDYPIVPEVSLTARAIYLAGLERGNNPHVFSKLGDCMTETPYFLEQFSEGQYDLGEYAYLQEVIDRFAGFPAREREWKLDSFATASLAAASGFNVAGPLDSTWANPEWCQGGESPLACEYRVSGASLAVLMFGTNDTAYTDPATFDYYLRTMVIQTLDQDVLPLLSTFPTRPEDPNKSHLLNQIVVKVATDYDLPLINLNRALEPLPNHGVNPENTSRLSVPADGRTDRFVEPNLQAGFTVRNLVTLQALYAVWQAVK